MLTHDKVVPYKTYIMELIAAGDIELLEIKLADLNDNSNMSSFGGWDGWQAAIRRYAKMKIKVVEALMELRADDFNSRMYKLDQNISRVNNLHK